jgi:uncharacterized heparinase superfamily protein
VTTARAIELVRKAWHKSPREIAARLDEEARRVARRPWSRLFPILVTEGALLRASRAPSLDALWADLIATPFFVAPRHRQAWVRAFDERYADARAGVVDAADRALRHEFELLGSGPRTLAACLPWHEDFKTGRVWPLEYSPSLEYSELDKPTDVKVPWELSRCQHFTTLGQAYWLTGDERYAQEVVDQVRDWIRRNPYSLGVNWACAMDVALRAVNWIWAFYFLAESRAFSDAAFRRDLLRSLYMHGEYIATHLEKGPVNGNHYLSDAVGLIFLGVFFRRTPKGRAWLATGREVVTSEMLVQVTDDGVDFEVSTAYHRLVLELFLTSYQLLRLHGEPVPAAQWERLERMCEFVEAYTQPDGLTPMFGDADDGRVQILGRQSIRDHRYLLSTGAVLFGRADFKRAAREFWPESFWLLGPSGGDVFDALPATGEPLASKAFPDGGFFVLRRGRTHVMMDLGDVGMRGIGGHGHNDILSFELVLDGVRVVSDCGAYLYTAAREWRNKFRSTAFHATIQVDGEEINRFISPDHLWQLRDDARPVDVTWEFGTSTHRVAGAHTGYRRLPDPVTPKREIAVSRDGSVVRLHDVVSGAAAHRVTWRFPLHPALTCESTGAEIKMTTEDGQTRWLFAVDGTRPLQVGIEDGWWSPSYGVKVPTRVIVFDGLVTLPHEVVVLFSSNWLSVEERAAYARALDLNSPYRYETSPTQ